MGCGKQREATAPIQSLVKTAALVPEFAVKDLPLAELHPGSGTCTEGPTLGQRTMILYFIIL